MSNASIAYSVNAKNPSLITFASLFRQISGTRVLASMLEAVYQDVMYRTNHGELTHQGIIISWATLNDRVGSTLVTMRQASLKPIVRHQMNRKMVMDAFASGSIVTLQHATTGAKFTGVIVAMEMESGPQPGKLPWQWLVKMISADDVVDLYIELC
jgi:hypothetical protein